MSFKINNNKSNVRKYANGGGLTARGACEAVGPRDVFKLPQFKSLRQQ